MRSFFKIMIVPFLVLFLCAGAAWATNITIFDENGNEADGLGQGGEDQETEPGMVNTQVWDLEGFILEGTILKMVGGYDFRDGEYGNGMLFESGDIFIDIDGNADFGDTHDQDTDNNTVVTTADPYGYDYVFDLNFTYDIDLNSWSYSWNLIDLSVDTASVVTAYYYQNQGHNPWKYNSGGTSLATGSFQYTEGLSDSEVGFVGGDHYQLELNISPLFDLVAADLYTFHYTMECGNDNLMGQTAPVPEPATLLLLGTGLVGLAGVSRRKIKNA